MRRANIKICVAEDKICFPRENLAAQALQEAIKDGRPEKRYYRCKFCHDWHLTSQPKDKRNRGRRGKRRNNRNSGGSNPGGFRLSIQRNPDGIPRIEVQHSEGVERASRTMGHDRQA